MSNMTPTGERGEVQAKPAWTRCDRCKQRLWNDRIDIEVHRAVCPADMARTIRNMAKALERMESRVGDLEARPEAHVVELEGGPVLDFEHEAPWPETPVASGPEDDDDDDTLPEVPDVAPSILQAPNGTGGGRSSYFDDEDDDDDLDPTAIRASVR